MQTPIVRVMHYPGNPMHRCSDYDRKVAPLLRQSALLTCAATSDVVCAIQQLSGRGCKAAVRLIANSRCPWFGVRRLIPFNIHDANTHLSRLVEEAARGESFIIAKAGKPTVKVTALSPLPARTPRRLGFLKGKIQVPDDFDRMGESEIRAAFDSEG